MPRNRLIYPKYYHEYNLIDFLIGITGIFFDYSKRFKDELKKILKHEFNIYLLDSGRSALNVVLQDLDFPKGSEVAIPVNVCEVVIETILRNNLKPLLIDITDNLTLCTKDLKNKVSNRTRAVIAVHALGNVCDINDLQDMAKKHNLVLIEDCAQTFTAKYQGMNVGIFGDYAFFSLDVTKQVSSFGGGVLITKKQMRLKFKNELGFIKILELILFKFLTAKIIYTYLTKSIISKIKRLYYDPPKNRKLSKVGTALAYSQIRKIHKTSQIRIENAKMMIGLFGNLVQIYSDNKQKSPSYVVLPIGVSQKIKINHHLEEVIDLPQSPPLLIHLKKYKSYWSECVNAERIQDRLIFLPTYIRVGKDMEKILKGVKEIEELG